MTGRRITTAVTLMVLLAILSAMAIIGFQKLTAPMPSHASTKKSCSGTERQVKGYLQRSEVQVSVFNAGSRSGFASTTLEKVVTAGFRAGNAGNAPAGSKVRRAVVWTTKPNDPAARLVAEAFGRRTRVEVIKTDLGPGVDVLVGDRFRGLDPQAARRIKLARPIDACTQ